MNGHAFDDNLNYIEGAPLVFVEGQLFHFVCCDCGLDHLFIFDKVRGVIALRVFRDEYNTQQHRKKFRFPKDIKKGKKKSK